MDINTLFFVESSLLFLFGFTMLANSLANPGIPGSFWFAASNFAGGVALVLQGSRQHLPVVIGIFLSNILFVAEVILLNRAVTLFLGKAQRMWIAIAVLDTFGLIAVAYLSMVRPNIPVRVAVISVMMSLPALMTASVLFGPATSGLRVANRLLGGILLFFSAVNMVRGYLVWRWHVPSFYFVWLDLIVIAGVAFSYVWMTAARLREDLERQALTDPLTGVMNRRAIETEIVRQLELAARSGSHVSALMLDMDHFKGVNDRFGHQAGDQALRSVAYALRRTVRTTDLIARLGGDEFMVILPGTTEELAHVIAERIRMEVSELVMRAETYEFQIRVSVGVTTLVGRRVALDELIKLSDRALYAAKVSGRNRVVPATEIEPIFLA